MTDEQQEPEMRADPRGGWVIVTPARSDRANAFAGEETITAENCPFRAPRRHEPEFTAAAAVSDELARLMQLAVRAIRLASGCVDYNWTFINGSGRIHWYLEITPRLTVPGGFDSGTFINIITPEAAAAALRSHFTAVE